MIFLTDKKSNSTIHHVGPLKSLNEMLRFEKELKYNSGHIYGHDQQIDRNVFLFKFGISMGLRISDIVKLKVSDVLNPTGTFSIHEKKTGKQSVIMPSNDLEKETKRYVQRWHLKKNDWLFPSRIHGRHVSTVEMYRTFKKAGKAIGRPDVGNHSLRKTFARFLYDKTKDLRLVQQVLNHASPRTTRRYIALDSDEIQHKVNEVNILGELNAEEKKESK